jgi:hypothetical protein
MKKAQLHVAVKWFSTDQTVQPIPNRSYPGQTEGDCVTKYLNDVARIRADQHLFLESMAVLWKLSQATKDGDVPAIDRLRTQRRGVSFAHNYFASLAIPTRLRDLRVRFHKEGLLLQPTTPKGQAAVAVLVLDQASRVDRIRRCLHCRFWFYARFEHQRFCSDGEKQCQWKHYHSAEWRKKHRERNRKHQAAYRKKLFG